MPKDWRITLLLTLALVFGPVLIGVSIYLLFHH